jgi:hypothetical protein
MNNQIKFRPKRLLVVRTAHNRKTLYSFSQSAIDLKL